MPDPGSATCGLHLHLHLPVAHADPIDAMGFRRTKAALRHEGPSRPARPQTEARKASMKRWQAALGCRCDETL